MRAVQKQQALERMKRMGIKDKDVSECHSCKHGHGQGNSGNRQNQWSQQQGTNPAQPNGVFAQLKTAENATP
jgi:hypothetical protein